MIGLLAASLISQAMDQAGVSEFWRFNCSVSEVGKSAQPYRVDAIYMVPKDNPRGGRFDYRDPANILNRPTGWAPAGNWLMNANGLPKGLTVWLGSTEISPDGSNRSRVDTEFSIVRSDSDKMSATLELRDFRSTAPNRVLPVEYSGKCTLETGAGAYDRYFGAKE